MCMDGQLWYQLYMRKWQHVDMEAQSIETTKSFNILYLKLDIYVQNYVLAAGSSSIHQGLVWKVQATYPCKSATLSEISMHGLWQLLLQVCNYRELQL